MILVLVRTNKCNLILIMGIHEKLYAKVIEFKI